MYSHNIKDFVDLLLIFLHIIYLFAKILLYQYMYSLNN